VVNDGAYEDDMILSKLSRIRGNTSSNHLLQSPNPQTTQIHEPSSSDTYEPSNFEEFEQRRETLNYTLKPHPLQVQLHEQQPQPEKSNPFTSSSSDPSSPDPIALANQIGKEIVASLEIDEAMVDKPIGTLYPPLQTEPEHDKQKFLGV